MKKVFTLIVLSMITFNVIHAEVTWNLSDDGTLTISGTDMPDYSRYGPWYSQYDKIKKVVIEYGVTNIGKFAFYDCTALTSITIPESVTSIGGAAFKRCTNLNSITIANSVNSIERDAFHGTKWYNDQPDGLVYAGLVLYAYKGTMPANANVTIKDGTKSIVDYTFSGSSSLKSITIPESVTSIGIYAFSGCSSLISVIIPNYVTRIGDYTFKNCSALTTVTIGNSVKSIGMGAFAGCSKLTSIAIPNSVTDIDRWAFSGCSTLTSVHITNLVSWCKIKFDIIEANPLFCAEHLFLDGKEIDNLVLPDGLTSIEPLSFYNCKSITSVKIPNTVTSIGGSAFYDCSNLTSITIPESVTNIGGAAFLGAKLRNIVVKANTPPTSGENTFCAQSYYHTVLMIPEGSWDAYAYSDTWYQFINIREMAYNAVNMTNSKAYMLKSSNEGSYLFYDSVNDCVAALNETALDDTEENNTWMTVEVDGKHYVYNLGAKKFLVADKTNAKTGYRFSDIPAPIDIEDGKDAIVFGKSKEFYMVINDKLNVDENLESQIMTSTGINEIEVESNQPTVTYNLNGQRINNSNAQKGVYIKNGKKYAK